MWRRVCSFMRAPRRTKDDSEIEGWSIRRWPTPGRPASDRNAHVLEMPDRADAGAQQMRRRMDGAAGQDHLAAAELLLPAVDQRLHADAARALEQQLLDLRVGRDRQVGALARLAIEIAHRGRDALLVPDWNA